MSATSQNKYHTSSQRNNPFESDNEIEKSGFQLSEKKNEFESFIEKYENASLSQTNTKNSKKNSKRSVYKIFGGLTSEEMKSFCKMCNNPKMNCHDLTIGPFCRDQFVRYYNEEKHNADLLTTKKIFFNWKYCWWFRVS